jgi:hypothetical protein
MLSAWTDPTDDLQQPSNYTGDCAKGHILNLWRAGFNIPRYAEEFPVSAVKKRTCGKSVRGSPVAQIMIGGSGHNTKYILLDARRVVLVQPF